MTIKRLLVLLLILAPACSTTETPIMNGSGGEPPAGQFRAAEAISVRAARVERAPISTFILSNTTLESIRKVSVFSRTNALVAAIAVEEGVGVKEGQLLARLDDREIRNEYDRAKIAVEQAELTLQQGEVKAQLSAANYERALSLFRQKLTSQQEFDQAALTNRTDELAYENAKQQLESAKAQVAAAEIQLEYTEITSPFDGVITARLIEVGDRVSANQEVFSLEEFPPLWARIYVPERNLPELREGQTARIQVETFSEETFQGRIKMISPVIDSTSGTVKVTLEVNQPRGLLKPGMFSTVYIATTTHPNALVVPKKAIHRERDRSYVYEVRPDNVVAKQEVETGFSEENRVEILSGLQEGAAIVTVGHESLSDGYAVNVMAWDNSDEPVRLRAASTPTNQQVQPPTASLSQRQGNGTGRAGFGRQGGGGDLSQRLERMLQNPEVKKAWEAKLKEDPELATDPEKQRAFFRELFQSQGGFRRP